MAIATVAELVAALRSYRQLAPEHLDALAREALPADVRAVARTLAQRGWLTTYQINELFLGRGPRLLLGSYVLLELLGEGGMGQVFKARNWKLGQIVALKLIRKERLANPNAIRRFYREIRVPAQLNDPHIVRAFDADEVNGTHFFVMEFVEGTDLYKLVKSQGPLDVRGACDYVRQAALGLQHAHERGLVHRDIKPHNLLLVSGGVVNGGVVSGVSSTMYHSPLTTHQVKILDMGLARMDADREGEHSSTMTQEGAVMGTPDYIAPEQGIDSHAVDIRADLYSLGCTLYFLLVGRPPFAGGTFVEKLLKHQQQTATPLRQLRDDVPAEVEAIVAKLMAKRPEQRYQTPAELARALEAVQYSSAADLTAAWAPAPAPTSAPGRNVFADLGTSTSDTAALVPKLIKAKAPPTAAGKRALKFGLLAAAGLLAMIVLLVTVRSFFGPTKPAPDPESPLVVHGPAKKMEKNPPPKFTNSLGMEFVLVPKGKSWLGGGGGKPGDKEVVIPQDFYLGVYEVTQEEWLAVTGKEPSHFSRQGAGRDAVKDIPDAELKRFPVESVSWTEAEQFVKLLNEKVKEAGWVYRLPTATEWEYACRGGPMTDKSESGFAYYFQMPTNELLPEQANWGGGLKRSSKVGSYQPNRLGLFNMHGNVWEWCDDSVKAGDGPSPRVIRGGSWDPGSSGQCFAAHWRAFQPSHRDFDLGLRVARVPVGKESK